MRSCNINLNKLHLELIWGNGKLYKKVNMIFCAINCSNVLITTAIRSTSFFNFLKIFATNKYYNQQIWTQEKVTMRPYWCRFSRKSQMFSAVYAQVLSFWGVKHGNIIVFHILTLLPHEWIKKYLYYLT